MDILPFNPGCDSLHSGVRSHHLRTSRASCLLPKEILLGDSLLWIYSNTQLHLPDRQHQTTQQLGSVHSLVCTSSGKSLSLRARGQMLTPPKIAPLFTNAFVYMAMGESSIPQLDKTLIRGTFWHYAFGSLAAS